MFAWTRIALLLAVPLLLYLVGSAGERALEAYRLRQDAARLRQEIAALQARNVELRRQIDYLRTDAYVEKVAREELLLVKPGETATVLLAPPQPEPRVAAAPAVAPIVVDARPTWQRWRDFLISPQPTSVQPSAISRQELSPPSSR